MYRFFFIVLMSFVFVSSSVFAEGKFLCSLSDKKESYQGFKAFRYLVEGKEGWIFRTKIDLKEDYTLSQKRIKEFQRFSELLKEEGVQLHLMMQPTRGISHASKVPLEAVHVDFTPEKALESYQDSIKKLLGAGLSVTDFSDYFPKEDEQFFFKQDLHWNSEGAKFTAKKTAEAIVKSNVPFKKDKVFITEPVEELFERKSNFRNPIKKICGGEVPYEKTQIYKTFESSDGEGDLFGETSPAEIVLAGTSNCAEPYAVFANYAGFLRQELSADVENVSISGGNVDSAILSYLVSDSYKNKKHKHLIWEVSAHYNIKGRKVGGILRQLIPATKGFCEGNEVFKTRYDMTDNRQPIYDFEGMAEQERFAGKDRYISFKFSAPTAEDFMVMIQYEGEETDRFRFERSENYPHDGMYFLSLDRKDDKKIEQIKILTNETFEADSLDFQVCSY